MDSFWQDLRYSLRVIRRNPGFVAIAVVALALGIGANTAIFSVVDAVLFRALPYKNPSELIWATNFIPQQNAGLVFADIYSAWRKQSHSFTDLAAYSSGADFTLTGAGQAERLHGASITANFFPVLGISPRIGRGFSAEEDRPGGPNAVLLTETLWRNRFGSDPGVIGRVISLDNSPYTVVGVLAPEFQFLDNTNVDLLVPFQLSESSVTQSQGRITVRIQALRIVARLRPGMTASAAQTDLAGITKVVLPALPGGFTRMFANAQTQVFSLHEHEVGNVQRKLYILLGAVGFVLLIACANVANLQLARSVAREKEVAIRGALGAGRARIAQLLLTESSVVALTGGIVGLGLAAGAVKLIRYYGPPNIPHLLTARLDFRVLLFTLGIALLTGLLFGLAPIFAAFRVSLNDTLKESGGQGGANAGARRPQKALMVLETALSLVLFVGAGLLIRSFLRLTAIAPGFTPDSVLTARVSLPLNEYQTPEQQRAFFQQLVERAQALPGVTSASVAQALPLQIVQMMMSIMIEGQTPDEMSRSSMPVAGVDIVTPGYFTALKIPLISGRYLDERDGTNATRAAVVNQAFVRQFFPHDNPLDKRIQLGPQGLTVIVGVVTDTKQRNLTSDVTPEIFAPLAQWATPSMTLAIRTSVDPLSLVSALRKVVTDLDANVPLYNVQTMNDLLSVQVASQRFYAAVLGAFAGLAVLLAAVGIYGVMAYAVGQRTHEIGVRMALGAERADVLRMVLRQGLGLSLLGVAIGLGASFGLTRLLKTMVFGVTTTDPATFTIVTAILVAVALIACWIPARRATKVDPVIALRYE
jgi:putative ABC transport system permease protein